MPRFKGYGQFCPVSRAAEILAERWTPLVVRELLLGSVRFNDLQRGVPRMSPALLSRRLKDLEHAGIVERTRHGSTIEYRVTPAGRELFPIIEGMGLWAQRWVRDDLVVDDKLDPTLLMWDVRRNVRCDALPSDGRYLVRFEFRDVPASRRRFWLMVDAGEVDLCIKDPGFDVDLYVSTTIRRLTEVWLGYRTIAGSLGDGGLRLDGSPEDCKAFAGWFGLSYFAPAGREPPGPAAA